MSLAETIKPEAQSAMRIAIWLLFVVYCLPLVVAGVAYLQTRGFRTAEAGAALEAFVAFTAMGDQSLSLVHRALLPLMAGLAPVAFADSRAIRSSTALMILLIVGIAFAVFFSAIFTSATTEDSLENLSVFAVPANATVAQTGVANAAGMTAITSFFNRTQETLGMYLLMLFGLTLTTKT